MFSIIGKINIPKRIPIIIISVTKIYCLILDLSIFIIYKFSFKYLSNIIRLFIVKKLQPNV